MKLLKILAILLLAVVAFHATGMEIAFCNDGNGPEAHSCLACGHTHYATEVQSAVSIGEFIQTEMPNLTSALNLPPTPARVFFRPPISL